MFVLTTNIEGIYFSHVTLGPPNLTKKKTYALSTLYLLVFHITTVRTHIFEAVESHIYKTYISKTLKNASTGLLHPREQSLRDVMKNIMLIFCHAFGSITVSSAL